MFKTKRQRDIAKLFYEAEDMDMALSIIKVYGVEGRIVFDMILAEYLDEVMDTEIADLVLKKYGWI